MLYINTLALQIYEIYLKYTKKYLFIIEKICIFVSINDINYGSRSNKIHRNL